jgi:hypothetical protein
MAKFEVTATLRGIRSKLKPVTTCPARSLTVHVVVREEFPNVVEKESEDAATPYEVVNNPGPEISMGSG